MNKTSATTASRANQWRLPFFPFPIILAAAFTSTARTAGLQHLEVVASPAFPLNRRMDGQGQFEAVVWDMDGLLLDTERLSFIAWREGAKAIGHVLDESLFHSLIGMNFRNIKLRLLESLGSELEVVELTRLAGIRYEELIAEGAPLKPGVRECLEALDSWGIPQALATSSSERFARKKLGHHDLLKHFKTLVTGDQVERSKPDPEPYLLAASRLGVDPVRCIAFEDSVNGIQSAHGAGMHTILIPDLSPHDEESLERVAMQFESLLEALPFLESVFRDRQSDEST